MTKKTTIQDSYSAKNNATSANVGVRRIIEKNSENIGGAASLIGSTIVAFNGDTKSILSVVFFTAAEITLIAKGHKIWGYSSGAALFAAGDLTLAFSIPVQQNPALQYTLLGMTAAWVVGATRGPLHAMGFEKTAEITPKICGYTNLALRVPAIATAALSSAILTTAISLWGVGDVLSGRLQENFGAAVRLVKKRKDKAVEQSLNSPKHPKASAEGPRSPVSHEQGNQPTHDHQ